MLWFRDILWLLWNDTILNYLETCREISSADKKRIIDAMVEVVECLRMNRNDWKYSKDYCKGEIEEDLTARVNPLYVSLQMTKYEDSSISFLCYLGKGRQMGHFSFGVIISYEYEEPYITINWYIGTHTYSVINNGQLHKNG